MQNEDVAVLENHDQRSFKVDYDHFLARFPEYKETLHIDDIRKNEFSRLDLNEEIYLDYTGASLYSENLIDIHSQKLRNSIFANPHSNSRPSVRTSNTISDVREKILDYFNGDPDKYEVIFTQNSTGAIKIVAESFPFKDTSSLLLSVDNHTSIHGMRRYAQDKNSEVTYLPIKLENLRINEKKLEASLKNKRSGPSLFAYPAQSNYSGVKHSLSYIETAKKLGWYTFLDVAAYVPTNKLDLSKVSPDFLCISFYKMFGFPTGIGCLIVEKKSLYFLQKPWFSGGSVLSVSTLTMDSKLAYNHARFEDGSVNFCLLPAIGDGLDFLQRINIESIQKRCQSLTKWILDELKRLTHDSGEALVQVLGPSSLKMRGPTICMKLISASGKNWHPQVVESRASQKNISIRSGHHCNPGCNDIVHHLDDSKIKYIFDSSITTEELLWRQEEHVPGVIRVSLGVVSNYKDAWLFIDFLKAFLNEDF